MTDTGPDLPDPAPARRFALTACMFLITGVFGFLQPFVPLYLTGATAHGAGLTREQFGFVSALGTGAALLIQPVLGRLSDRWDARRPFMVLAALSAGAAYLLYRHTTSFWGLTLLTAIGVNGFQYLNAVGGVLVGRMVRGRAGGGAAYVRYRVWGSVGYIVIAIGTGLLVKAYLTGRAVAPSAALSRADLEPVFLWGPLLFFVIAAVSLVVPDAKTPPPPTLAPDTAPAPPAPPNLDRFLVAYFLYQFSLYGASAFLSIYIKSLGASPEQVTAMFAAGVVCEVLVMSQVGRWTDTHGRRPALVAAFLLMPVRLLLYIPAAHLSTGGPLWVLGVQTLHGLNFGIVGTIAIVFVNDQATDANRGRLQARLAASAGLGLALGPLACGWIAQRAGMGWMFASMSAVGASAAWVLITRVAESHPAPVAPASRLLRRLM